MTFGVFCCCLLQCQLLYCICEEYICCNFEQRFTPEKAFFFLHFLRWRLQFALHLAFRYNLAVKNVLDYRIQTFPRSRLRHIYINGLIALKIRVEILRYRATEHAACARRDKGDPARSGAFGLRSCEWCGPNA